MNRKITQDKIQVQECFFITRLNVEAITDMKDGRKWGKDSIQKHPATKKGMREIGYT